MLLAGIVMKLGAYGGLRVAMNLFPQGFQMWRNWIAILAVNQNCLCRSGAPAAARPEIRHRLFSVSHMGFVLFGPGQRKRPRRFRRGLQMFSHGVIECTPLCHCWTHRFIGELHP